MRPVGTFLDFTRLYVYVYSMFTFFFFFLVNKLPAKSTILSEILYTFGQMDKVNYFGYCYPVCFYMVHFFGIQFQVDRLFCFMQ